MAINEYLADSLIDAVREEGLLPSSDEDSTTPKVRRILNREQRLYLQAFLQKAREEFQTDSADITIVSGTTDYAIPSRAAGASIRRLENVTDSGVVLLYPVDGTRNAQSGASNYGTGDFVVLGNKLRLIATPANSGTLRVVYARRFNAVVPAEEACVITAINTSTKAVTMVLASDGSTTTLPTLFTSSATYDFVGGTPHFSVLGKDLAATVAANVLTFALTLPTDLAVGDMVALAGQTPICNAPLELHDVLALKACHSYCAGSGDAGMAALLKERLTQAELDALVLISPRVKDCPPMLINYSGPGWHRGRGGGRRY